MLADSRGLLRLALLLAVQLAAIGAAAVSLLILNRVVLHRLARWQRTTRTVLPLPGATPSAPVTMEPTAAPAGPAPARDAAPGPTAVLAPIPTSAWAERCARTQARLRGGIWLMGGAAVLAALGLDAWFVLRGQDALEGCLDLLRSVPAETWWRLGLGVVKILVLLVAARWALVRIHRGLAWVELRAKAWQGLKANDASVEAFCRGLGRTIAISSYLLLAAYACTELLLPASVGQVLYRAISVYLTIAVGLLVVRMTAVVVDTLDAYSQRYVEHRSWSAYYRQLRPLIPTFRRCLEYALWVVIGTAVVWQLEPVRAVAEWGPRLIQVIGIFFLGRVGIELGYLLLDRQLLARADLAEAERRRRETIRPLLRTVFRSGAWFAVAVLMLDALGIAATPFLAGAGILGMVVGLGAQPLIHDVVSGFFIIFENIFLVGDIIEGAGARGTVEAIDFRTTRIRDGEGRLHVIRNGDLRQVINFSKDHVNAVVEVRIGYEQPVAPVLDLLKRLGVEAAAADPDILAPSEVPGIVAFNDGDLTLRTVTRVKPGCHYGVSNRLRLRIKEAFDAAGFQIPPQRREVRIMAGEATPPASGQATASLPTTQCAAEIGERMPGRADAAGIGPDRPVQY